MYGNCHLKPSHGPSVRHPFHSSFQNPLRKFSSERKAIKNFPLITCSRFSASFFYSSTLKSYVEKRAQRQQQIWRRFEKLSHYLMGHGLCGCEGRGSGRGERVFIVSPHVDANIKKSFTSWRKIQSGKGLVWRDWGMVRDFELEVMAFQASKRKVKLANIIDFGIWTAVDKFCF